MTDFDAVMSLITLLADPAAAKAKLTELQATIDAADAREAEVRRLEGELATERARLANLEKAVRAREVDVRLGEEGMKANLNKIEKWERDRAAARLIQHPNGLTQEPDDSVLEPSRDPINDRLAEPMGQSRGGAMTTHAASRVSRATTRRGA